MRTVSGSEAVGAVGEVVTRVRGTLGPGEVRVLVRGSYDTLIAYSDAVMERGDEVLVVDDHGPGSVDVVPWPLTTIVPGAEAPGVGGTDNDTDERQS